MPHSQRYYTLVASLPYLPPLFAAKKPPMSRERLESRLEMLVEEDRRELAVIEDLMHWDRLPLEISDRDVVERAREVIPNLRSETLRQVATWRMEIRTVVAGLRRRAAGKPPPSTDETWGYGHWTWYIEHNWNRPDFGLAHAMPSVVKFHERLERNDVVGLERVLLDTVNTYLARTAEHHYFTFETVAIYVLRWNVIARWTGNDPEQAQQRFDYLVDDGLGKYGDLFAVNGQPGG